MRKEKNKTLIRTAEEVKNYRIYKRLASIIVGIIAILVAIIYIASALVRASGSFTVQINRVDNAIYGLVLSDTESFTQTSTKLDARAEKEVTNICYSDILLDLKKEGSIQSKDNYVVATFYVRNEGNKVLDYAYEIYIENITQELDKAVRIYVSVDNTSPIIYSHWNDNLDPEYICPFDYSTMELFGVTKNFKSDTIVFDGEKLGLKPYSLTGDYTKFTIIIWIEGDDPDCTDDKVGGKLRVSMLFSVINFVD